MTAPEFHKAMRDYFGIPNAGRFMDTVLLQVSRSPKLDVLALDDWLHEKHGEYESEGLSMRECIAKHYGEPAAAFVEGAI